MAGKNRSEQQFVEGKKGCSKIIYTRKKPCCRTLSNHEDFQQCSKIKDSLKIIALGFQTHMPPICNPRGVWNTRDWVCLHAQWRVWLDSSTYWEVEERKETKAEPQDCWEVFWMFSPVQDSLSFWGTVMQGDPNQSQGILSTNKHYYADTFLVVGFLNI